MDELKLLNKAEKVRWMDERMAKGYSFNFIKSHVEGATYSDGSPELNGRNVAVTCVETGETLRLLWG